MITEKLKTMAEAEDYRPLQSKRKAITALLPYAVWQERDGQPEMLDTILRAVRASRMTEFMWRHIDQFVSTLFSEASPCAIVLVSPHIRWSWLRGRGDLVQWWVTTTSMVPHAEEVAQSVVDTLLQVSFWDELVRYIPVDLWLWLTEQPSLPPVCRGRDLGTHFSVIEAVQALKDIEVLKSYLLLIWSEWGPPYCFDEMCTSLRNDFGEIGMRHHRADLIQRLDHVLGQLDRGLEYLSQQNQYLTELQIQKMKDRYGKLKEVLLEMNIESIAGTCHLRIEFLSMLTQVDIHRIPHNVCVRSSSPMSIALCLEPLPCLLPLYTDFDTHVDSSRVLPCLPS